MANYEKTKKEQNKVRNNNRMKLMKVAFDQPSYRFPLNNLLSFVSENGPTEAAKAMGEWTEGMPNSWQRTAVSKARKALSKGKEDWTAPLIYGTVKHTDLKDKLFDTVSLPNVNSVSGVASALANKDPQFFMQLQEQADGSIPNYDNDMVENYGKVPNWLVPSANINKGFVSELSPQSQQLLQQLPPSQQAEAVARAEKIAGESSLTPEQAIQAVGADIQKKMQSPNISSDADPVGRAMQFNGNSNVKNSNELAAQPQPPVGAGVRLPVPPAQPVQLNEGGEVPHMDMDDIPFVININIGSQAEDQALNHLMSQGVPHDMLRSAIHYADGNLSDDQLRSELRSKGFDDVESEQIAYDMSGLHTPEGFNWGGMVQHYEGGGGVWGTIKNNISNFFSDNQVEDPYAGYAGYSQQDFLNEANNPSRGVAPGYSPYAPSLPTLGQSSDAPTGSVSDRYSGGSVPQLNGVPTSEIEDFGSAVTANVPEGSDEHLLGGSSAAQVSAGNEAKRLAGEHIKQFEGFRDEAYQDSAGVWTIGYGRTQNPDGSPIQPGQTTDAGSEDAWFNSRHDADKQYVQNYGAQNGYDWSPEQVDALTSFTYNLGRGSLQQLTKDGRRTDAEIANAIPEYNRAGGEVIPGLTNRRIAEQELFAGDASPSSNIIEQDGWLVDITTGEIVGNAPIDGSVAQTSSPSLPGAANAAGFGPTVTDWDILAGSEVPEPLTVPDSPFAGYADYNSNDFVNEANNPSRGVAPAGSEFPGLDVDATVPDTPVSQLVSVRRKRFADLLAKTGGNPELQQRILELRNKYDSNPGLIASIFSTEDNGPSNQEVDRLLTAYETQLEGSGVDNKGYLPGGPRTEGVPNQQPTTQGLIAPSNQWTSETKAPFGEVDPNFIDDETGGPLNEKTGLAPVDVSKFYTDLSAPSHDISLLTNNAWGKLNSTARKGEVNSAPTVATIGDAVVKQTSSGYVVKKPDGSFGPATPEQLRKIKLAVDGKQVGSDVIVSSGVQKSAWVDEYIASTGADPAQAEVAYSQELLNTAETIRNETATINTTEQADEAIKATGVTTADVEKYGTGVKDVDNAILTSVNGAKTVNGFLNALDNKIKGLKKKHDDAYRKSIISGLAGYALVYATGGTFAQSMQAATFGMQIGGGDLAWVNQQISAYQGVYDGALASKLSAMVAREFPAEAAGDQFGTGYLGSDGVVYFKPSEVPSGVHIVSKAPTAPTSGIVDLSSGWLGSDGKVYFNAADLPKDPDFRIISKAPSASDIKGGEVFDSTYRAPDGTLYQPHKEGGFSNTTTGEYVSTIPKGSKKIGSEDVDLPAGVLNTITDLTDSANSDRTSAYQFDNIIADVQSTTEPFAQGFAGTLSGWAKSFLGAQGSVDEWKANYNQIKNDAAIRNLPPGVASDTDIKIALQGFPSDTWNREQLVSWMRGYQRLLNYKADYSDFRAGYIEETRGAAAGINQAWADHLNTELGTGPSGTDTGTTALGIGWKVLP